MAVSKVTFYMCSLQHAKSKYRTVKKTSTPRSVVLRPFLDCSDQASLGGYLSV